MIWIHLEQKNNKADVDGIRFVVFYLCEYFFEGVRGNFFRHRKATLLADRVLEAPSRLRQPNRAMRSRRLSVREARALISDLLCESS